MMVRTCSLPQILGGAVRLFVAVLLLAGVVSGCTGPNTDRAAVAAAKCALPVQQRLGVPADEDPATTGVHVADLGSGRYRVTGIILASGRGVPTIKTDGRDYGTQFLCEVAPDSSDTLRGFKVTRLDVGLAPQ
jgi:hypothetical protein